MTPTPSQDARDYAAQVLRETGSQSLACEVIRTGGADNNPVVQAFARFEAHLRSTSPDPRYGKVHADGSRFGGQPPSPAGGVEEMDDFNR